MRISAYHDLPFAIFRYDPKDEFKCRKHIRLLSLSLEAKLNKKVTLISLGKILWKIVDETEGMDAIINTEKQLGFTRAQQTVNSLLLDQDFLPLTDILEYRLNKLNPAIDIVFLVRVGGISPAIYRCSALLDQLHGRVLVPIILFYPGSIEGQTSLRFMNLPNRNNVGSYNYRVKIYGGKS
ncbi:MAG: BREX protein BrxB domain-containing protein [Desulfobaccales bacterium]